MNTKRTHTLNESVFAAIESEAESYWLGFLMADGSVHRYGIRVELHSRDRQHLEKLKEFMNSSAPIRLSRKKCCIIDFNSVKLVEQVQPYGLVANKTMKTATPTMPSALLRHFYRGIFDGDGWLTSKSILRNGVLYDRRNWEIGFSSGSATFIEQIHAWVMAQVGCQCGYHKHRRRGVQSVHQLTFGGNRLFRQIGSLLFDNATVFLDRKKAEMSAAIASTLTPRKKRVARPKLHSG